MVPIINKRRRRVNFSRNETSCLNFFRKISYCLNCALHLTESTEGQRGYWAWDLRPGVGVVRGSRCIAAAADGSYCEYFHNISRIRAHRFCCCCCYICCCCWCGKARSAVKLRTILPFGLTNWALNCRVLLLLLLLCLHCRERMASAA